MSQRMTKPTKWHVHPADSNQPGHAPSLISLHCPHEKRQIRLDAQADRNLLGTHAIFQVLSCAGSYINLLNLSWIIKCLFLRDVEHLTEMPTIQIIAESYRFLSLVSTLRLWANKDFKMVQDKIPMWRKLYLFAGSKIGLFSFKKRLICVLFIGKT